jgi:hypothetical protein
MIRRLQLASRGDLADQRALKPRDVLRLGLAAAFTCLALGMSLSRAQTSASGPSIAIETFTGATPETFIPKAVSARLLTDMLKPMQACKGTIVEWERRADILGEQELSRSRFADPTTAVALGQLIQPDAFVRGAVSGSGPYAWSVEVVAAVGGEVLVTESGTAPTQDDVLLMTEELGPRLAKKLCEKDAGYAMIGTMDEATITGTICGKLHKPFKATSPEVGGNWSFVPGSPDAGTFTYMAVDVGGVSGSGGGSYTVVRSGEKVVRIQLAGTGAIHSPLGTFTAEITESIALTPVKTCGRVGDK